MAVGWMSVVLIATVGLVFVASMALIVTRALAAIKNQVESTKEDLDTRRRAVDDLIGPIGQSLCEINEQLTKFQQDKAAIGTSLATMAQAEGQLRKETSNLVQALRQPAVRGKWGEMLLDRVVEIAGMQKHCTHETQEVFSSNDRSLRPDLVVYLPGNAFLAVDAKAPMNAYLDSLQIEDEQLRVDKLKQHARQIRDRIAELSRKAYWELFPRSPGFVILFIPGEVFLMAALQQDPELLEVGIRSNVHIAGPMTLISLLRATAVGWREEQLAKNAEEIRRVGLDLYRSSSNIGRHLLRMRKTIIDCVNSFDELVASMERNLLQKGRRLHQLGAAGEEPDIATAEAIDRSPKMPMAAELTTDDESNELPRIWEQSEKDDLAE